MILIKTKQNKTLSAITSLPYRQQVMGRQVDVGISSSSEQCLEYRLRHNLHPTVQFISVISHPFWISSQTNTLCRENLSRTTIISKTGC